MLGFMVMKTNNMKIAVLSGKGGTGKTLVAVNLAALVKDSIYIDCDVEEPNGHLFFKPTKLEEKEISVLIPKIDNELCNGCRKCVEFCNFNALAYIKNRLVIFDDICHSCGGCIMLCSEKAFKEKEKVIGKVQKGVSDQVNVYTGILNTGEASGVPIIKNLLDDKYIVSGKNVFIDCPPGSACIVMESIKDADYCILVAEPTLFGEHNLKMVFELVKLFNKPFGVVLNKCLDGDNPSEQFCLENNIKIIGRISFDKNLGTINSNAEIAVNKDERYRDLFSYLLKAVIGEVEHETTINS